MNFTKLLISIGLITLGSFSYADLQIAFIRHGEKPKLGLGQLNCQGLNRSLALPSVLKSQLGKIDYLYAPNPTVNKPEKQGKDQDGNIIVANFPYIRPLATIEPLAISLEKSVNISFSAVQVKEFSMELEKLIQSSMAEKETKTVVVAWEHKLITDITKSLLQKRNATLSIPDWQDDDFDSIYILHFSADNSVTFEQTQQGLKELSKQCPNSIN